MKEKKFKVGDEVKVVDIKRWECWMESMDLLIGAKGKVVHIAEEQGRNIYQVDGEADFWYFPEDSLELV